MHLTRWLASAAVAALAAFAQPAQAQDAVPQATGYFGGTYEWIELGTPRGDADTDGFGIDGSFVFNAPTLSTLLNAPIGVQLDASYIAGDDDENAVAGTAHVFTRDDQWLWGGFASYGDVEDTDIFGFGGELNRYFDRLTVAGTAGWTIADDIDTDAFSIAGEGRYFLDDNLRVDGGLGWTDIDVEGEESEDTILLSVGAERKFDRNPVSVFAGYTTAIFADDIDTNRFLVGVRYNFSPTLRERDRSGPALAQQPLATRLIIP